MEVSLAIILIVCGLILLVLGFIGSVAPGPGPPLAFAALLLLEFGGVHDYNNLLLIAIGLVVLVIFVADYFIPIAATKKFGGSKQGVRGSTLGVVIGFIVMLWTGPLAIILGPFLGAMVGELIAGKPANEAAKVGLGTLMGFLVGVVGKLMTSFLILITFAYGVIAHFIN